MKILALEFSSPQRSVAVLDGTTVLAEQAETAGQSVPPLRLVEQALAAARVERGQIECVAVGLGPGSYTGIRGAIALAQGWQLAGGVKLIGVSSVECIAMQAQAEMAFGRVNVVIDAQRGEFYLSGYEIEAETIKNTELLKIVPLTEVENATDSGNQVVGPEVTRWFPSARVILPSAAALGRLAATREDFVSGEHLEPIYLRATSYVKAAPPRIL
jgi:tRNA threonylcarbamoyl adenosine modification protein YeaZ